MDLDQAVSPLDILDLYKRESMSIWDRHNGDRLHQDGLRDE